MVYGLYGVMCEYCGDKCIVFNWLVLLLYVKGTCIVYGDVLLVTLSLSLSLSLSAPFLSLFFYFSFSFITYLYVLPLSSHLPHSATLTVCNIPYLPMLFLKDNSLQMTLNFHSCIVNLALKIDSLFSPPSKFREIVWMYTMWNKTERKINVASKCQARWT